MESVKTHAWVSAESMLDACLVGMLVRDELWSDREYND